MGSAYHWEARRRQSALDWRQRLLARQEEHQQEPKKGPKGELHSKKPQPQPEPQESGPSWARPQLPAAQPPASQPRRPPQRSGGQDAPRRGSLQHSLQPGPSPRTDCRPQAWPPILPGSGLPNPCQPGPAKNTQYSRLSSTDYVQQW